MPPEGGAITSTRRSIAATAAITLIAVVTTCCGSAADGPASFRERGYPAAPIQQVAEGDRVGSGRGTGIAGLPDPGWVAGAGAAERTGIPIVS